jgi:FkbM family methyltransferase
MSYMEKYIENCKVILDIGANCGVETGLLSAGISSESLVDARIQIFDSVGFKYPNENKLKEIAMREVEDIVRHGLATDGEEIASMQKKELEGLLTQLAARRLGEELADVIERVENQEVRKIFDHCPATEGRTVYAFEPHNEAYLVLYNKFKRTTHVNTFNAAVSNTVGISELQYKNNDFSENRYGGSTIVPEVFRADRLGSDTSTQMVMTTTIDALNLNPDCIKIDAEGSESNILIGGKNQIVKNKPVIIFEYGSSGPPENFQPKSIEILQSYGYTRFIEAESGLDFDFRHPCSTIDIIALHEEVGPDEI